MLEQGPQSAAALADRLGTVARRRSAATSTPWWPTACSSSASRAVARSRGRGRPARTYALTDAGRGSFPHAYDDLANTALRYLRDTGGEQAVEAFAEHRAEQLAGLLAERVDQRCAARHTHRTPSPVGCRPRLRFDDTDGGYLEAGPDAVGTGVQICQHHCPVAHVAAEFPQLCEAETRAFEQVLGTYVQRLATIAHGDGVCTTHVPYQSPVPRRTRTTHPIREDHR